MRKGSAGGTIGRVSETQGTVPGQQRMCVLLDELSISFMTGGQWAKWRQEPDSEEDHFTSLLVLRTSQQHLVILIAPREKSSHSRVVSLGVLWKEVGRKTGVEQGKGPFQMQKPSVICPTVGRYSHAPSLILQSPWFSISACSCGHPEYLTSWLLLSSLSGSLM